jgi:hypothetical protein
LQTAFTPRAGEQPNPVNAPPPSPDPAPVRDPDPKVTPLDEDERIKDGIDIEER